MQTNAGGRTGCTGSTTFGSPTPATWTTRVSASTSSIGVAVCVLRAAAGGPVDLDRHAACGGSRVEQIERCIWAVVGEEPRALADDHWIREQDDLVDEVVVEEPAEQLATPVHLQLAGRLGFQLAD